ncbi:hypothetical protein PIB30_023718 [Stylosanthes scabra]|uniref:Methyltransferase type 11 domain-containing protein n=1 Tax=Stylosanthes scabra TaxID=79078 RepID=A0ABU6V9E7_9FABA|nr:hypothetical protein [Stylosanthes scabra]
MQGKLTEPPLQFHIHGMEETECPDGDGLTELREDRRRGRIGTYRTKDGAAREKKGWAEMRVLLCHCAYLHCGSGLFSRKFTKFGTYSGVVALDFSENMLRQCYDFINKDDTLLKANLGLVRADVCRLPFSSGSIDAVHASAALHCWLSPSNSVAEISRILRSGGIFVGTTFLRYSCTTPMIVRSFREVNCDVCDE